MCIGGLARHAGPWGSARWAAVIVTLQHFLIAGATDDVPAREVLEFGEIHRLQTHWALLFFLLLLLP